VFAFTDPKSNTGKLYPTYLLNTMGATPERFFKRFLYSYSRNKSVEMIAKKIVDGASVESIVYNHMLKMGSPYAKQTRVIKRAPPYVIPPVVVTWDVDLILRKKVKDAFLNIQKTVNGRRQQMVTPMIFLRDFFQMLSPCKAPHRSVL